MDKKLDFKPLSSGLGFHPFSDGMPYAPVTKAAPVKPRENPLPVFQAPKPVAPQARAAAPSLPSRPIFHPPGQPTAPYAARAGAQAPSGATAAGAPRYARVSVPVAAPSPLVLKHGPIMIQDDVDEDLDLLGVGEHYGLGYLAKRVLAYSLDTAINLGLCAGAMLASLWKQGMSSELIWNPGVLLLVGLFLTVFNWAVITAQEVAFGTSAGKRVFGLAIDGPTSRVFLRSLFFLISAGFCGVGLFWAVANPRKRCWHDLVVDLQPIEIASL
jgi:uncharacterized RDD family membrane protein YckC